MSNLNLTLTVGALALGVLFYIYEYWSGGEHVHEEGPHASRTGGHDSLSEDEYEVISETTNANIKVPKPPTTEEDCPICLERLISINTTRKTCLQALPECGHWFHKKCLIRLLEYHPHCPVCRKDIDSSMIARAPVRVIQVADNELLGDSDHSSITSFSEPSTTRRSVRKCTK